jgi:Uma2 family endonuclease
MADAEVVAIGVTKRMGTKSMYPCSVERYHAMVRAGILTDEDRVELLEGAIVEKHRKTPAHSFSTRTVREELQRLYLPKCFVGCQDPVTTEDSEPEPDVSVIRGKIRDYSERHPLAAEVSLVVEVADSTLERDQSLKKRIYARAGVPVYWIVNLIDHQIEVYTGSTASSKQPGYRQRCDYRSDDLLPVVIDCKEIGRLNVADLLP